MVKKVFSIMLAVCMVLAALPCMVFAADEIGEIEAAKKADKVVRVICGVGQILKES